MSFTINGEGEFGGTQSVQIPSGNTANRPASPDAGEIRFNTDTGKMEYWSSTSDTPQWRSITESPVNVFAIEYLAVGGGGGAGAQITNSGGYNAGVNGQDTRFGSVLALGGGGGGRYNTDSALDGGSGGGAASGAFYTSPGTGTAGQGNDGGNADSSYFTGGGGGGAGAVGDNAGGSPTVGGDGGIGLTTTIISTSEATTYSVGEVSGGSVYFAGGGAGCGYITSYGSGVGGLGGGGDGLGYTSGSNPPNQNTNGAANTGGGGGAFDNGGAGHGGGGAGGLLSGTVNVSTGVNQTISIGAGGTNPSGEQVTTPGPVCRGGSGVLILKYDSTVTATFTGTVTENTFTSGSNKISIIKATSGDCFVSFSK